MQGQIQESQKRFQRHHFLLPGHANYFHNQKLLNPFFVNPASPDNELPWSGSSSQYIYPGWYFLI